MKKFKVVSNIMLFVASAMFALGVILSAVFPVAAEEVLFLPYVQANAIILACSGVGVFLIFSKVDTAKKVGNGLTIAAFVTGAVCALSTVAATSGRLSGGETSASMSIGAICMIVAAVLLFLHYAFLLVNYIINKNSDKNDPNEDIRIIRVKEWKQLKEEGIITEEEFEEKRVQILGIKTKTK